MVERQEIGATIDALEKLATALDVEIGAFFVRPPEGSEPLTCSPLVPRSL